MTPQVLSLMKSKLYCGHETRAAQLNSTFKWKYLLPDVKKNDFICFFGGGCTVARERLMQKRLYGTALQCGSLHALCLKFVSQFNPSIQSREKIAFCRGWQCWTTSNLSRNAPSPPSKQMTCATSHDGESCVLNIQYCFLYPLQLTVHAQVWYVIQTQHAVT